MVFFQVSHMVLKHPKLQASPSAGNTTAIQKQGAERLDLW